MRLSIKKCLMTLVLLFPVVVYAEATAWKIIPKESSLTFTGTQNGSPVSGKFTKFSGDINFDPYKLDESKVNIIVDTNSISASYGELVDALKTPDWFNVKAFPQAIFKASQFTKINDKTYEAKGSLTIRDKTQPVTITFTVNELGNKGETVGTTTIKRNIFGVGQGEWASTDEVKDDVKVDFKLIVEKK